jgi:hypothetical protein
MSGFLAPKGFEAGAMPSQDGLRLNYLGRIEQTGPNSRHPYQQRPVTAVQPQTRRRSPQCDVELMTEKQVLGLSRQRDLNMSAANVTSKCRIARIEPDDAMILAHIANLDGSPFRKGQPSPPSVGRAHGWSSLCGRHHRAARAALTAGAFD